MLDLMIISRRRTVSFNKIDRKTVTQSVIEAIQQYIIKNKLKQGDPLPPEQELSETLNVSRNILREALRHFRTLGIISSRPRIGLRIERLIPEDPFRCYLPYIISDKKKIEEIKELRLILETGMISEMIANAKPGDIEFLGNTANAMKKADYPEQVSLDREFHKRLLEITGNGLLISLQTLTVEYFELSMKSGSKKFRSKKKAQVVAEHLEITEAIRIKDENTLRKLIRKHYDF